MRLGGVRVDLVGSREARRCQGGREARRCWVWVSGCARSSPATPRRFMCCRAPHSSPHGGGVLAVHHDGEYSSYSSYG